MSYELKLQRLEEILREFRYLKSMESLFELDQWGLLPEQGAAYRQEMQALVAARKTGLFQTAEARELAQYFAETSGNTAVERGVIRFFLYQYRTLGLMPQDLLRQYNLIRAQAMFAWKKAREAKDFAVFAPYLEQVFTLKKQLALAANPDQPAFDTLVAQTDEGLQAAVVSREFEVLKHGLKELLGRLRRSGRDFDDSLLHKDQDPDKMLALAKHLVGEMGFDPKRGTINQQVIQSFTSFMGPRDSRISTYKSGNPHLLYSLLHESGHAMYSYSTAEEYAAVGLWGGSEGGFHESQSRFMENIIGRSRAYAQHLLPLLQETFPDFAEVTAEGLYQALNRVQPSLQRINADEVTYSLHAIIRFELERDWFAGKLTTQELKKAWDDKYEAYLGVRPQNDLEGILQDMHWAGDYIGYFQSYALGNIYDGQILAVLLRDVPDCYERVGQGNFAPVLDWLRDHIWQYGIVYTGSELMTQLTGKALDAQPFLAYLNRKYGALYGC